MNGGELNGVHLSVYGNSYWNSSQQLLQDIWSHLSDGPDTSLLRLIDWPVDCLLDDCDILPSFFPFVFRSTYL